MKLKRQQLRSLIESLLKEQVLAEPELQSRLESAAKLMSIARGDNEHITDMLESLGELQAKVQKTMCSNQDLIIKNIDTTIKGVKASFYQIADENAKKSIDNMELALKDIQSSIADVCEIGPTGKERFLQDVMDALKEVALAMDKSANSPKNNETVEIQDRAMLAVIDELTKDEYLYIVEDGIKFLEQYVDVVSEAADMFRSGDIPLPLPPKDQTRAERRAEKNRQDQENLETLTKIFNTLRDTPRGVQKVVGLMRKIEQLTEEVMLDNAYSQEKVKEITSKFRKIYITLDLIDTLADVVYDLLHPIDYVKNAIDNRKKPQYDEPVDYIEY